MSYAGGGVDLGEEVGVWRILDPDRRITRDGEA